MRHDAERLAAEVGVQAGDDDADAAVDEGARDGDDAGVEELGFVYPDDAMAVVDERKDVRGAGDGDRAMGLAVARGDGDPVRADVVRGFEHDRALARDGRPPQPPYELIALAGRHATDDDLDAALFIGHDATTY